MAKEVTVIFLVDKDERYLLKLKDHLEEKLSFNARIYTYTSGEDCVANLNLDPEIVVLDYYFIAEDVGGKKLMNGIELIKNIKAAKPNIHLIMLSSETDVEIANTAIQEGARDYIIKYEYAPIQLEYLINNIVLNRMYGPKINYWKFAAIAVGVTLIILILYIVTGHIHIVH
jgi:DNA-binding NarL/FixJ family response regulator